MPEFIQPEYQIYTPDGVVASIDGNTSKKGAMSLLANLIPDPETEGFYVCRSAAYALTAFLGFITPGYISVMKTIGNLVVGMIATGRNPGNDEPFVFNLTTGAFITVSGVTGGNTPTSPSKSGAWTPPTIDAVGAYIVFTHPGFSGSGANFFGAITISGSTYTWSSQNTGTNALPSVPTGVAIFYDRAYYICGNVLYYSDVLAPLTMTNATNSLTLGGSDAVIALVGQPFFTSQAGGIIAALLAFKNAQVWQVTGDLALNTLALNKLSDGIGTQAPRSVINTPVGIMFVAPDGIRTVDLTGQVSEADGDLALPFLNPIVPSRVAATYNVGFYRICTNFLQGGVLDTVEYWYSTKRKNWCGPHSLIYDCIVAASSTFYVSGPSFTGKILQSNVIPNEQTDFYTELGVNLTWQYQTTLIPEFRAMPGWSLIESSVFLAFQLQQTITAKVLDPSYNTLGAYSLNTLFLAPANATNWQLKFTAQGRGGTGSGVMIPTRHMFQLSGTSTMNLGLGSIFAHYQYQDDDNAYDIDDTQFALGNFIDFGLVTDPILNYNLDWGGVSDMVLATVDFETLGTLPGNP